MWHKTWVPSIPTQLKVEFGNLFTLFLSAHVSYHLLTHILALAS
jgi:hypothetical protein